MEKVDINKIQEYFNGLIRNIDTSTLVPKIPVSVKEWCPRQHYCHDNVSEYCKLKSENKQIYGFLIANHPEKKQLHLCFIPWFKV